MRAALTGDRDLGPRDQPEALLPGEEPLPPPAPKPRGRAHAWLLLSALAAPLLLLPFGLLLEPDARGFGTHEQLGLAPCGAPERWGLPCPGCGVTTAVALAARGRLGAALATQPLGLLIALALPSAAVWALVQHVRGRDLARELGALRARRLFVIVGVAVCLPWLYRMVVDLR